MRAWRRSPRDTRARWLPRLTPLPLPALGPAWHAVDWCTPSTSQPASLVPSCFAPALSFAALFADHGFRTIDVMFVDVEGAELEVIRSVDFERVRIRVIVAETVTDPLLSLLRLQGFRKLPVRIGTDVSLGDQVFVNDRFPPALRPFSRHADARSRRHETRSS